MIYYSFTEVTGDAEEPQTMFWMEKTAKTKHNSNSCHHYHSIHHIKKPIRGTGNILPIPTQSFEPVCDVSG